MRTDDREKMYKVAGTLNLSADELVGHLNYR